MVSSFCGRGNQANKLTFSTTCSVPCLSLLAPTAAFAVFPVATQLGFVPRLWRGWQQHRLPLFLLCKEGILERQLVPGHTILDKAVVLSLLGRKMCLSLACPWLQGRGSSPAPRA